VGQNRQTHSEQNESAFPPKLSAKADVDNRQRSAKS
jgi:hypothetical protein